MHKIVSVFIAVSFFASNTQGQNKPSWQKSVDSLFAQYNTVSSPGYAVGIIKGNKILYTCGYGSANLDYGLPITDSSAFDIASVSKQFTGACIALLIMDGKIKLDMPASLFVPELAKYKDTIRIMHLLYNTSGIVDYYKLHARMSVHG